MRFVALLIIGFLLGGAAKGAPSLDTCRRELTRWEGYKTVPYRDDKDMVVGIGHNLTASRERVKPRYSPLEIERFFLADLSRALDACRAGIRNFDYLPEDVQLVCIGLVFTMGRTGFMRFYNLRRALSLRAYGAAAVELHLSQWRNQVSAARFNHSLNVLRRQ